jgi:hypothetical protein
MFTQHDRFSYKKRIVPQREGGSLQAPALRYGVEQKNLVSRRKQGRKLRGIKRENAAVSNEQ